jgi:putative hemolysin
MEKHDFNGIVRIIGFLLPLSLFVIPSVCDAVRNPAAVYCTAMGYEYVTEETEYGPMEVCVLPDGQRVDAHGFVSGMVALDWSYCAQNGLEAKHVETSETCRGCLVCVLEDGSEVEVKRLMGLRLEETTCGDGTCGIPENFETCPVDCPSGGWDGLCDSLLDGIIDPDCEQAVGLCRDTVVAADEECTAYGDIDAGSYDPDASDLLTWTQDPPGPYPLGDTLVTLTVTDATGASAVCEGTVTVEDVTPPEIALNGESELQIECQDEYSEPGATAVDNCDSETDVSIGGDVVDTSTPAQYVVTYSSTDDAGNLGQANRVVDVVDTTPPVIAGISASKQSLWPPNHKMKSIEVAVTTSDVCDPQPAMCVISSVASDEPEYDCVEDDVGPDAIITGDLTVDLRAERCSEGDGRVYTIEVTCSDVSMNDALATVEVIVPHDSRP